MSHTHTHTANISRSGCVGGAWGVAHRTYERTDALEGTRADAHMDAEHARAGF